MGVVVGPYHGLISALADVMWELAGHLLVRTTAAAVEGATTLLVETTHRWPASGKLVIDGTVLTYSSLTATTFVGLAQLDGTVGLPSGAPARSAVMEWSRTLSDMDKLRGSFLIDFADGVELDVLGRNYGLKRPRGVSLATWRELLKILIYLPAQTMYACEQVLDALLGPETYEIWEDFETYPHTVFVTVESLGSDPVGRTFLVGGEEQARTTVTTVTVGNPVTLVYGVYAATDPYREGENYANAVLATITTAAVNPTRVSGPAATFVAGDVGKDLVWQDGSGESWQIATFVSDTAVTVDGTERSDGRTRGARPTELVTDEDWWRDWMVGHSVEISGSTVGNDGTYVISAVVDPNTIRLTGATFLTETDVTYQLHPTFANDAVGNVEILRATAVGAVITTPRTMPVNVLVDYTTVPSAQVLESELIRGADQFPFYLYDGAATAVALLDLITAAGVRVVAVEGG